MSTHNINVLWRNKQGSVDLDQAAYQGLHSFIFHLSFWRNFSTVRPIEPRFEKTGFLHMRKQRRRSALR